MASTNAAIGRANRPTERLGDQDLSTELRAFKDISKDEEITISYIRDVKKHGFLLRKRKTAIKKDQCFDCKCPVCLGQVSCQEKILKKLIELHSKLNPTPTDWKKEASMQRLLNKNDKEKKEIYKVIDSTVPVNYGNTFILSL